MYIHIITIVMIKFLWQPNPHWIRDLEYSNRPKQLLWRPAYTYCCFSHSTKWPVNRCLIHRQPSNCSHAFLMLCKKPCTYSLQPLCTHHDSSNEKGPRNHCLRYQSSHQAHTVQHLSPACSGGGGKKREHKCIYTLSGAAAQNWSWGGMHKGFLIFLMLIKIYMCFFAPKQCGFWLPERTYYYTTGTG